MLSNPEASRAKSKEKICHLFWLRLEEDRSKSSASFCVNLTGKTDADSYGNIDKDVDAKNGVAADVNGVDSDLMVG